MLLDSKKEKQIVAILIVLIGILTVGHYINNSLIILAALIAISLFTFIVPTEFYLPIMLFLLTWSGVMRVSASTISWYTIIQTLYVFVFVFRTADTRFVTMKKGTIVAVLILLLNSCVSIILHNYDISLGYVNFMIMLVFVPLYLNIESNISFRVCGVYYSLGTVLASFAGLLFLKTGHMSVFVSMSEHVNTGVNRISGLSGDPNGYAGELLAAVGVCLVLLIHENALIRKIIYGGIVAILVFFGFMTVSKSFLLLLIVLSSVWAFYCIFCSNMKHKTMFIAIIIILMIVLISLPQTQELLSMYQTRFSDKGTANDFSSGRYDIWRHYFSAIFGDTFVMIFGNGFIRSAVVPVYGVGMAAHNTIIQIVYQAGFIGTTALLFWFRSIKSKFAGSSYKRFEKLFIAFMLFAPWLALDKLFFDDFFLFIMLYKTIVFQNHDYALNIYENNRG